MKKLLFFSVCLVHIFAQPMQTEVPIGKKFDQARVENPIDFLTVEEEESPSINKRRLIKTKQGNVYLTPLEESIILLQPLAVCELLEKGALVTDLTWPLTFQLAQKINGEKDLIKRQMKHQLLRIIQTTLDRHEKYRDFFCDAIKKEKEALQGSIELSSKL